MSEPACPNCHAILMSVRPKRIKVEVDDLHWRGRVPEAMGFACVVCNHLLPLTATQTRDDI